MHLLPLPSWRANTVLVKRNNMVRTHRAKHLRCALSSQASERLSRQTDVHYIHGRIMTSLKSGGSPHELYFTSFLELMTFHRGQGIE